MIEPTVKQPIGQEVQEQEKKTIKHIGSMRMVRGLTVFKYDLRFGTLEKAVMQTNVQTDGKIRHEIKVTDYDIYFQALNRKNAVRKLANLGYKVES